METGARVCEVAGVRICDVKTSEENRIFHKSYTKGGKTRPMLIGEDIAKKMYSFIKF